MIKTIDIAGKKGAGVIIEDEEIKGFTIKYQISQYFVEAAAYTNDKYAFCRYSTKHNGLMDIGKTIEEITKRMSKELFTDEEIVSPCATSEEFERRKRFLTQTYIMKVEQVKPFSHEYEFDNNLVYDPISQVHVYKKDEEFVKHHIFLWKRLQESIKPSVFPRNTQGVDKERTFLTYCSCIRYAEDDDPFLPHAKEYVTNNARYFVKNFYKGKGGNALPMWLVKEGYIKAPTMKILLDMANQYGDSQFAAVILDVMKSKKKRKSEFKL